MSSLWKAEIEPIRRPALAEDARCDLVVVGSGIAGLSSAYEAARCGADVLVIDRGEIAGGMTARTTAHLVSEIDDRCRRGRRSATLPREPGCGDQSH